MYANEPRVAVDAKYTPFLRNLIKLNLLILNVIKAMTETVPS